MKMQVYVIIALLALISIAEGQPNNAQKNNDMDIICTDASPYYAWIKKGKIFLYSGELKVVNVPIDTGRVFVYVYRTQEGGYAVLSGRLDGINELLKREVSEESTRNFLKQRCTGFLMNVMASGIPLELITPETARDSDPKKKQMLESYVLNPIPKIQKNEWFLEFNVRTELGAVEHWNAVGFVKPLSIHTFSRKILEPNGTFERLRFFGTNVSADEICQ